MPWTVLRYYLWINYFLILPILSYCQIGERTFNQTLDSLLQVYKNENGFTDSVYVQLADSLIEQSFRLANRAKFDEARFQIRLAEKICHSFMRKDHFIYPKLYYSNTYLFSKENDMPATDSAGSAALKLLRNYEFVDNEYIASIYFLLAYSNDLLQNRTKALHSIQNAIKIAEKKYGAGSDLYFRYYNGLCNIYKNSGQTEMALASYQNLLALMEKTIGKKNKNYINCLSNLSNLYLGLDSLSRVEELRTEAMQMSEQVFGRVSNESMIALFNLGTYYKNVRQWSKAKSMLMEAKSISDSLKGERIYRTRILNNLISLTSPGAKSTETISLHQEILKLVEQSFGKKNSQYALALGNLAMAYVNQGMNREAEQAFSEAIGLYYQLKDLGYDFQKCRSGIAILKFNQGKYQEVIDTLESVVTKKIENHKTRELSFLLADIYLLCHTYLYSDLTEKADSAFKLAEKLMVDKYRQILSFMSFSEFENYIAEHQYFISQLLSGYHFKKSASTDMAGLIFNDIMLFKSMLLNQFLRQRAKLNSNPALKQEYDQFRTLHALLGSQMTKPNGDQRKIDSIRTELERMEKNFSQKINQSENPLEYYTWQDLRTKLLPVEAAIEFVAYDSYLDSMGNLILYPGRGISYCALIVRNDSKNPTIVPLCSEDELLQCVSQDQADGLKIYDRFGSSESSLSLYDLVWKKLEPQLKDVSKIYFSPAGLFNRINLGAIPVSDEEKLLDRYDLIQLIGTRQLIELKQTVKPFETALLVGGIDYESAITDSLSRVKLTTIPDLGCPEFKHTDSALRGGEWFFLSGSAREIDSVGKILSRNQLEVSTLSGRAGSEGVVKSFRSSGHSSGILHFATHGYFFPDIYQGSDSMEGTGNVFIRSESPMLRSGLILAGGNRTWRGLNDTGDAEDGILTAYEASQMDLSHTGLVVLSACETGLGDIRGNEGVFGLQRAFKIAGADYIIMSLWKVPDQSTMEFMIRFYYFWLDEKMTIPEAFKKTQLWMRDRYPNSINWAGFVLIQ
ncbi:MAG TPA: CHAT domain-containing protein [Saprospiraceae bacterium]|nr:CHAT domain-containing protein [Saprospiraceae bacterium]